ncbi:MAG: hypothetical protein Q9190_004481 [Brigantiaea leucoxantha]
MCLFKIDPKEAPINPPGAAPTLMTLEEDHQLNLIGEKENIAKNLRSDANPTSAGIVESLDLSAGLEPSRPVTDLGTGLGMNRTTALPAGVEVRKKSLETVDPSSVGVATTLDVKKELHPKRSVKDVDAVVGAKNRERKSTRLKAGFKYRARE